MVLKIYVTVLCESTQSWLELMSTYGFCWLVSIFSQFLFKLQVVCLEGFYKVFSLVCWKITRYLLYTFQYRFHLRYFWLEFRKSKNVVIVGMERWKHTVWKFEYKIIEYQLTPSCLEIYSKMLMTHCILHLTTSRCANNWVGK